MSKKKKTFDGIGIPPRVACVTEYGSNNVVERITFVLTDLRTDKILKAAEFWAKDYTVAEMEDEVDALCALYDSDDLVIMHGHCIRPIEYYASGKATTVGILRHDFLKYLKVTAESEKELARLEAQDLALAEEVGGAT